jgi:lipoprotein-anchoring transpeptidase ErfK/SrfK
MRYTSGLFIEVTKKTHVMKLYHEGEVIDRFKVTVGKPDKENHTPSGIYVVTDIARDPIWHVPARVRKEESLPATVKPYSTFNGKTKKEGNQNALGVLWIGLRWVKNWNSRDRGRAESGLGIHGTNEPDRIGGSWGHGCVRMKNEDVRKVERYIRKYGPRNIKVVIRRV